MAKQVTLTHFVKKPRIEINNYLEDQSVDRNGTTSTDANRQADLPMANQRSLLHLIAPSDLSALGEPATQPHLQAGG